MAATFGAGVGVACVVDVGDQVVNFWGKKAQTSKERRIIKKLLENFSELR